MQVRKTLVSCAVLTALGLGSAATQAAVISEWKLGDVLNGANTATVANGTDGDMSDFRFGGPPNGHSSNKFGALTEMCGGSPCAAIAMDGSTIGADVFTTGFNFGGIGVFAPNTFAGGLAATIVGTTLTFSSFNFAGLFRGATQFNLAPNILSNCTGAVGCGITETMGYDARVVAAGVNTWNVRVRYVSTINDPEGSFNGFVANWRLEGTMTAVPVPAAAYLFGSGLLGLAGLSRRKLASK